MQLRISLALLIPLAACSGGDSQSPDAPSQLDASTATVRAVTCPASGAPTVTTTGSDANAMYMPMSVTISRGGIIKFMMPLEHNVIPNSIRPSDPNLKVDFGATACLEFDKSGVFNFLCSIHSFTGSVVVQ